MLLSKVSVCYSIVSNDDVETKVYWNHGDGFREEKSKGSFVLNRQQSRLCLQHEDMVGLSQIRLDPVDESTEFTVDDIQVKRQDLLFPWREIYVVSLDARDAEAVKDIDSLAAGGEFGYRSASVDPSWIWSLSTTPVSGKRAFFLNLVTLLGLSALLLIIALVTSRRGPRLSGSLVLNLTLGLLFYILFLLLSWSGKNFIYLLPYANLAIYYCFALLGVCLAGMHAGKLSTRGPVALAVISFVLLVAGLDFSYRLNLVDRPIYSVYSHDQYHWRANRNLADNLIHSSIRYYDDFSALAEIVSPGSHFLSDVATSYYVSAALPLFPVNVHPHHFRYNAVYDDFVERVCSHDNEVNIRRSIRKASDYLKARNNTVARYMILNSDRLNSNVRRSCLNRNYDEIRNWMDQQYPLVYEGEFLAVFEIEPG
jgi:hypothetical protein